MPIESADIKTFKASSNLGGAITTTEIENATLENLLGNIGSAEAASGETKYACLYIQNKHASLTLTTVKAWIQSNTPSDDTEVKVGLGVGGKNTDEPVIANEHTAPDGVSFTLAAAEGGALALPNLENDDYHAIWLEWTVSPGATPVALDDVTLRVKGDTPIT